jgi:hypothetical protein
VPDNYRKCAYLLIRDNGDVNIELTNCNTEKQPYICKYSNKNYNIIYIIKINSK